VAESVGTPASILRSEDGSVWTRLATSAVGPDGVVSFEDQRVAAGRHGYRIVVDRGGAAALENEVWIEVRALALALRGAAPNPARAAPIITFTLPSSAPAQLDVLDLVGRRVASRGVGPLGPGTHELRLTEMSALASGIYVVRLRQAGREVSRRAVIAR